MAIFVRRHHFYLSRLWNSRFGLWLRGQPWTRICQKQQQYYGERFRSWLGPKLDSYASMPFPYHSQDYLDAYESNKLAARPDDEAYWKEQQRILDLKYTYSKVKLLQGYPWFEFLTYDDGDT